MAGHAYEQDAWRVMHTSMAISNVLLSMPIHLSPPGLGFLGIYAVNSAMADCSTELLLCYFSILN